MPPVAGWGIECKKSCAFPLPGNKLRGPSSESRIKSRLCRVVDLFCPKRHAFSPMINAVVPTPNCLAESLRPSLRPGTVERWPE